MSVVNMIIIYIFKVQYPIYIKNMSLVDDTQHGMYNFFKQYDIYQIRQEH